MNSTSPFVTIEKPSNESIVGIIELFKNVGLQVVRTFDLREARLAHPDCPCPHHGTEDCDCQISVLLVYDKEQPPASLLIHSFQDTTWVYPVDTPEHPVGQRLDQLIQKTLTQLAAKPIENRNQNLDGQGIPNEIPH
jgi:hypothetical protein